MGKEQKNVKKKTVDGDTERKLGADGGGGQTNNLFVFCLKTYLLILKPVRFL